MFVTHAFQPVYDRNSRILILGTMPSPQSIRHGFYYSHPQNRFWPILAKIFSEALPQNPEEKRDFVLRHHIALWDVLASCEICGAADSSIKAENPNDISIILNTANIKNIYTTGKTAYRLYQKHLMMTGRPAVYLPSTSPANRALWPMEKLLVAWQIIAG